MNVGIALGSGSARGWAHIGVLEALAGMGIVPRVVAGTSIGAVVGAAYAAGRLSAVTKPSDMAMVSAPKPTWLRPSPIIE